MSEPLLADLLCRHFRTKAMFTREAGEDRLEVTETTVHFPYCWCARSATELGPDDGLADAYACSRPERSCHLR
jgi:hypothetical protein